MRRAEAVPARVLLAGLSTRALAASAVAAGYRVTAVDAFGDLDLREVADVITTRASSDVRFSPGAAARAASSVAAEMVAYTSNFENYPAAVAALAKGRELLGNRPSVLRRVRNPLVVMRQLKLAGFAPPLARATCPPDGPGRAPWLMKPRRSGGGHGTALWRRSHPVPRTHYLQEYVGGIPGSILFAAEGRDAVALGLSRQLVGDANFGASGYRYCGSLIGSASALFPRQAELLEIAARMATAVTGEFGLVGLNGIDFIARNGVPHPIEVNPRYSASMELIERLRGVSLFEVHVHACRGSLPAPPRIGSEVAGKAIVYARRDVTMGDTRPWVEHGSFADVPGPGEKIGRGRPICTVFAQASGAAACRKLLIMRAREVYRAAESRRRAA